MPTQPITTHALLLLSLPQLTRGDIVTYHGSYREFHGIEFVVDRIDEDGRMRLVGRGKARTLLHDVRRTSVTPTGEVEEQGSAEPTPPALSKAAQHLLLAISRAARSLRRGVLLTTRDIHDGAAHLDGSQILARASAGPRLEALVEVARAYMRDCPELGVTEERLAAALTGETADLFTGAPGGPR
ncbi:hypothetical protein [Nocardia wallacei]|uniref:hypothetical protein n=1 Tax=Nocardia wallacei TaxID=480035 RepID=UPI002454A7EF|nr:hypothetical protein [Nocardia wallacei]